MERCHVVYDVLKTHIQFGAYRFGDVLPAMENNTENFLVSLDTIRSDLSAKLPVYHVSDFRCDD